MLRHRLILGLTCATLCAVPVHAQPTREPQDAADLALALRRLGPTQRVLMVGAHPDDENTAVLAELALGSGADVAYLALTRGEGGQNLIGPELQEGLGLIRTEELLAARRVDGARQFFTRAYDYGFSKSADEAFRQWPHDSLLADVVAVVREFRPDVMIAVFSGTPRDGHGQHQASGILAREAFAAAGDPATFPGQIAAGLVPHRPRYLYQSLFRGTADGAIELEAGTYDPVFGRSHYQMAMASRSRHRSQDMGTAEPPGPQAVALVPVAGNPPAGAATPFAGSDTTLVQRATKVGLAAAGIVALEEYDGAVAAVRDAFNPLRPEQSIAGLAQAARLLDDAARTVDAASELAFHIAHERAQVGAALRLMAGVTVAAIADRDRVVPGGEIAVTLRIWNGGPAPVSLVDAEPVARPVTAAPARAIAPGSVYEHDFRIAVPVDADPTMPYFLRRERDGAMYRWPADFAVRGRPFQDPPFRIAAQLDIAGARVAVAEEATYPQVDKSFGELQLPVFIVPAANVRVEPRVAVAPRGGGADPARELTVTVTAADTLRGTLALEAPADWSVVPASTDVSLAPGDRVAATFRVTPPASAVEGEATLTATVRAGARSWSRGYVEIAYPHTRPRMLYAPASTRFATFPARIAAGLRIGYIEGAGDDGAEALLQLGGHVEPIDAALLATGDLSVFNVIVAGIRAYEVRPDLIANNGRVLDWVRAGGTFVVQYNKYELVEGGFAPYPLTMARPHGRVTDEHAEVTLLRPDHPLLTAPNRIGPSDFDGWVQERGLYFADTWDPRYTPLLAMADAGEAPLEGSLLVADVGQGHWIYTGLALFRQWPEAVPGAFRLLANMVSYGQR